MSEEEPLSSMLFSDYLELQSRDSYLREQMPHVGGRYERSSDPTIDYNCLSWAVERIDTFFDPLYHLPGYSWPPGVIRSWSIEGCSGVLEFYGYVRCDDGSFEDGVTKVVMFLGNGVPTHFARQVQGDKWTSKLGDAIDIVHDDLECIICEGYGEPRYFFKKNEARVKWPPKAEAPNTASS